MTNPVPAPWRAFVKTDEAERLAEIEGQIQRKHTSVDELGAEKFRIMRRAIMRMRRAKNTGDPVGP